MLHEPMTSTAKSTRHRRSHPMRLASRRKRGVQVLWERRMTRFRQTTDRRMNVGWVGQPQQESLNSWRSPHEFGIAGTAC